MIVALDPVLNFAKCPVSTGYASGVVTIILATGFGAKLPDPAVSGAFNLVWWDSTDYGDPSDDPNVEICRCTARLGDTLTLTRAQEGTLDSNKNIGGKTYYISLDITEKMITDIQANFTNVQNQITALNSLTLPAYEAFSAGDLLKAFNDAGTYKLKKIIGFGANITGTFGSTPIYSNFKFVYINTDKIVVIFYSTDLYAQVGTISGATITFGAEVLVKNGGSATASYLKGFDVKKTDNDGFVVFHWLIGGTSYLYGRAATVSGITITFGTELIMDTSPNAGGVKIAATAINTDKFAVSYAAYISSAWTARTCIATTSGSVIAAGTAASISGTAFAKVSTADETSTNAVKVDTDVYISTWSDYSNNNIIKYSVCVVSGTAVTPGAVGTLYTGTTDIPPILMYQNGTNAGVMAYADPTASATTLFLNTYTRSGSTVTKGTATTIISGVVTGLVDGRNAIMINGEFLYFYDAAKIVKYGFDGSGNFINISSYTVGGTTNYGSVFANNTDRMLFLKSVSTATPTFNSFLLDYDEFLTSPNAPYLVSANVPYNYNVFTGFTNLRYGQDYYIKLDASGITNINTWQKVGKAIDATTILKN